MPTGIPILFAGNPDRNPSLESLDSSIGHRALGGGAGLDTKQKKAPRPAAQRTDAPPGLAGDGFIIVDERLRPVALDQGAQGILDELNGHCRLEAGVLPPIILNLLNDRPDSQVDGIQIHLSYAQPLAV